MRITIASQTNLQTRIHTQKLWQWRVNIPHGFLLISFKLSQTTYFPMIFWAVHMYSPPSSSFTFVMLTWLITSSWTVTYWPTRNLELSGICPIAIHVHSHKWHTKNMKENINGKRILKNNIKHFSIRSILSTLDTLIGWTAQKMNLVVEQPNWLYDWKL